MGGSAADRRPHPGVAVPGYCIPTERERELIQPGDCVRLFGCLAFAWRPVASADDDRRHTLAVE
jgi:hypothetical protein